MRMRTKFKVHLAAMAAPSTSSLTGSSSSDHELWGWQQYFQKIERFIGENERQFGNCNEDYAQYAIERFEFFI